MVNKPASFENAQRYIVSTNRKEYTTWLKNLGLSIFCLQWNMCNLITNVYKLLKLQIPVNQASRSIQHIRSTSLPSRQTVVWVPNFLCTTVQPTLSFLSPLHLWALNFVWKYIFHYWNRDVIWRPHLIRQIMFEAYAHTICVQ